MQKTIKISGVEDKGKTINLLDGKLKYSFWKQKKDQTQTKAYTQFKQYGFEVGNEVKAEVEESPETFTNTAGKEINFTRRTILYFAVVDDLPVVERNTPSREEKPRQEANNAIKSPLEGNAAYLMDVIAIKQSLARIEKHLGIDGVFMEIPKEPKVEDGKDLPF